MQVRLIEERVRELPGVQQVAWSGGLPPGGADILSGGLTSDALGALGEGTLVEKYYVGPDFFALYRIPILRGRALRPSDAPGDVVVGERLARALWPGLDPIGRSFRFMEDGFHVIGVAREIHHPSLDASLDRPELYAPFAGAGNQTMMSVRCGGQCPEEALLRQRLASVPGVRIYRLDALDRVYFEQLARPRAAAALGFAFAAIAILASAGGLFSVLTYAVGRRRREFGIRTALGASPGQIRQLVIRDGLVVAAMGIAVGMVAAWSLARALASLQYGVTIGDPISWLIVFGLLGLTVAAATWRPAREAMRVDPVLLLKDE